MATIKTPAAGVSPYQDAAAEPTVLRAGADGATVLATATPAATATGANTNVIINGQAALNNLITTSQTGVFDGANVTINLEEQNFNTTNQVTSNTNYPSGNTGEIQFNSGSNSFASDAYFTYTNSNVVTPGIRTDGYFYANGAPFVSGGNATVPIATNSTPGIMALGNGFSLNASNQVSTANLYSTNLSEPTQHYGFSLDTNGVLHLPDQSIINGSTLRGVPGTGELNYTGITIGPDSGNAENTWMWVDASNAYIATDYSNVGKTWTFDATGNLTLPDGYGAQLIVNQLGGPGLFTGGATAQPSLNYGDRSNVFVGDNIVLATDSGNSTWTFAANGSTIFPTLTTQRGDNPSGTISGQTLLFGNSLQEAIISTPNGTVGNEYSQRLVINPGAGNNFGEGGDIYLWAGRGGDGSGSGGDIKIRGGQGGANTQGGVGGDGGYIRVEAGDAASTGGNPGYVQITGGYSNTVGGYVSVTGGVGATVGGNVKIYGGYGQATGGNVNIWGGGSGNGQSNEGHVNIETGGNTWTFAADGSLQVPSNANDLTPGFIASANGYPTLLAYGSGGGFGIHGGPELDWMNADDPANSFGNSSVLRNTAYLNATGFYIGMNENSVVGNTIASWLFTPSGNLSLPGNTFAVNYANGDPVVISGGNANTGNVTFDNQAVVGTGDQTGGGGLYLAPGNASVGNVQYLRVRGGDYPTHIHLDTGNNQYFDQYFGDDNKYIVLSSEGNILINTNDLVGNTAQWIFGTDGNLTTPGASGNITGADYISANVFTAPGNVTVTANVSNWIFGAGGNLTFPTGMHIDDEGANTRISQNEGYLKITAGGNAAFYTGWAEAEGTGTGNVALMFANGPSPIFAGNMVIKTGNQSSTTYNWIFDNQGNLTFPSGMHIDNNGGNTRISLTDGFLKMSAGSSNAAFQAGWVETIGSPTGNVALIVANDYDNLGNLVVKTGDFGNASTVNLWNFDNVGNLTLPGNLILPGNINGNGSSPAPSINGFDTINSITMSASGNITGDYFFGNGSGLTGMSAATVPSQAILPTIQTITAIPMLTGYLGGGQGGVTVTVANTIPVTEFGVIVTAGTTSQKYATGSLGNAPGTGNITFTTGLNSAPFTVYAYVTSNAGTYYSNAVTGTSGLCLLAGTQIALSDGSHKAIEHITYTDKLLSWDFDRGCYAETTALWIKRSETGSQYNLLTFSDGTTLRTFDQHRIFNKQAGAFTYPMTAATPVGTVTVNEHGQEIVLTSKQVIEDTIDYYNVITDHHMNLFSDRVLTSCRFNNIYPVVDMKFVKDSRTPRTRAEFANIPDRFFHGLRLSEQTADVDAVEWYVNRLVATEVSTQVELVS
jgi:hypothetical protein